MSDHTMLNGTCSLCGCRAWEKKKPCVKPKRSRAKKREIERRRELTPGSGEYNDAAFGENN